MTKYPSNFSSSLRLSQKLGYGFGAIFSLGLAFFPAWVSVMYVRVSGEKSSEIFAFIFFMVTAILLLFVSLTFWLSIFRNYLLIEDKGITYQGPFTRRLLTWDKVEGFAYTKNQIYLVCKNSTKRNNQLKWVARFKKFQPILIPLSQFTNEWPPSGKPLGPLMSTIFQLAPHLFNQDDAATSDSIGANHYT